MTPAPSSAPRWPRLLVLAPALVALVAGGLGGLVRAGWTGLGTPPESVAFHGGLMVAGFFGTLIALERAVALGTRCTYAAPILSGLGAAGLLVGVPFAWGAAALTLGSAVFTAASLRVALRQPAAFTATMLLGAASLLVGNVLWVAGVAVFALVPWWVFFILLTIAGERLELSRLVPPPLFARRLFAALVVAVPVAAVVALRSPAAGAIACGALLLAFAAWLARWDVARRTVRLTKLPRFVALCLFAGYVWLALAGGLWAFGGALVPGLRFDAIVHAVFLGFAFSMVFGHAPVIFPAVVRIPLRYRPSLYVPAALLHASVALRIAGDLGGSFALRRWAGLSNGIAILVFLGFIVAALVEGLRVRVPARSEAPARGVPSRSQA